VTTDELARLLEQYSAGIDAEVTLLLQLAAVARHQHEVTQTSDFVAFTNVADTRDSLMRSLVALEDGLRPVRQALADHRDLAKPLAGYDDVVRRHREAAQLVTAILATDQQSIAALADAELARRSAVASLERGETTLAAYRRVLSPPIASASLVDKIG
jgi:hypothetical protein